jgi:hypothetical protein
MKKLRLFDLIAVLFSIGIIAGTSFVAYSGEQQARKVHIQSAEGEYIYPLEEERELKIPGPLGDTAVTIHNETVRVTASPCNEKICIAMGEISKPGSWIACLPNRVFIRIGGDDEEQTDATSF